MSSEEFSDVRLASLEGKRERFASPAAREGPGLFEWRARAKTGGAREIWPDQSEAFDRYGYRLLLE